jgi:hypothetical protein
MIWRGAATHQVYAAQALRVTTFTHVGPSHNVRRFSSAPSFLVWKFSTRADERQLENIRLAASIVRFRIKFWLCLRKYRLLRAQTNVNSKAFARASIVRFRETSQLVG